MGGRLFIATALLVFAIGLLSSCALNTSTHDVDDTQVEAKQPSTEPTLVEEPTPMPEPTMTNDGTLIIEGDMLVRCADLLQFRRNYWEGQSPTPEARRQMRQAHNEQVRVCTKAGFPPDKTPQSP